MYLWGLLCFLFAFAATGECLECVTCKAVSSESCSVTTTGNCSDGQVCASQLTLSVASGVISRTFTRSCAPPSECSVLGTFTHDTTVEKVSTTCCSIDLCTPGAPTLPSANSLPNGVTCPTCTLPIGSCSADQYMNCTGDLTMCLVMTTQKMTGAQSVVSIVRGCASSGYCFRNNQNYTEGGVYTEITYTCPINSTMSNTTSTTVTSPPSGTSHRSSSLSALISIFFFLILM